MQLDGARALVTGGSAGIGREVALRLAAAGAEVLVTGREAAALEEVATRTGGRALAGELAEPEHAAAVAGWAGEVDLLVNNAGGGYAGAFAAMPVERVDALLAVNVRAALVLTRALLPGMLARGSGAVVFVTSIAGLTGVPGEAVYAATKAALTTFADSLRAEVAPRGVTVSTVAPGVVDTAFFARRGAPYDRRFPRPVPPGRIADAVLDAARTGRAEVVVPRWLTLPARLRGGTPAVYRALAGRFAPPPPSDSRTPDAGPPPPGTP